MNTSKSICLVGLLFLLVGCASDNFKDVPPNEPRAMLHLEGSRGLFRAQTITPLFVNGVPANSRNNQREIAVPPGKVELVLVWDHSFSAPVKKALARLAFVTEANKSYHVFGIEDDATFTFSVRDSTGSVLVSLEAPKEDAVYRPFYP